ncbi:MAG: PQQ-dependent sugar dehydrogenase [Archangiaceae bacterium]|nr:PQQ-dependent sugar dehydrogenase [Archangiaceae bacterium]
MGGGSAGGATAGGATAGGATAGGSAGGSTVDDGGTYGLDARPSNTTCIAPNPPPTTSGVTEVRVFPKLTFSAPLEMLNPPGEPGRIIIGQRAGAIVQFPNDQDAGTASVTSFLDLTTKVKATGEGGLLGIAFHPQWATKKEVYVSYTENGPTGLRSVVSRFKSTDNGATLDVASEEPLFKLDQPYDNHKGGNLAFGPDGFLYIGFGDGGSQNDPHGNGQRVDTLLSKMLRIDVNVPYAQRYAIPPTNPFAGQTICQQGSNDWGGTTPTSRVCAEIYARGFRNPWRWSFDTASGELWVGDVGQGSYEEVDRVVLGGNYGWNTREGKHCLSGSTCNTVGLIDPVAEYDHGQGQSITGGFVYRGTSIPTLVGKFIVGDYQTRRVWAVSFDSQGQGQLTSLYTSAANMGSFGQLLDGEVYVMALIEGRIYKLAPSGVQPPDTFPKKLSTTGCFDATDPKKVLPAMVPYGVNAALWSDGATKDRYFAIPDGTRITVNADGDFDFPNGTVTAKTFWLGGKRIETRLFMKHLNGQWAGYTYEWDDLQTDATLLPSSKSKAVGAQTWFYPSRAQCVTCHNTVSGNTLGLELAQLNGNYTYPNGRTRNQVTTLDALGFFAAAPPTVAAMPDPFGTAGTVQERARAYLHANCSICHRNGAGQGPHDFRYALPLNMANLCNQAPSNGDLGVTGAKLLVPGNPAQSLVSLRMKATNVNRMPPLASTLVHGQATALVDQWINSLTVCP